MAVYVILVSEQFQKKRPETKKLHRKESAGSYAVSHATMKEGRDSGGKV